MWLAGWRTAILRALALNSEFNLLLLDVCFDLNKTLKKKTKKKKKNEHKDRQGDQQHITKKKTKHFAIAHAPPSTNTSQTLSDEKAYSDFTLQ